MSNIMENGATVMCTHGATVQPVASITRVTIGGMAPLAKDDTFAVAGCPFTLPSTQPSPCTEIQWLTATVRVTAGGKKLLLDSSTGLCKAATSAPQGAPLIIVTQQRVSAR